MGSNLRSTENAAAPMPQTAIIPATPKHSTAGEIYLTGVPQLPSTMPSAAAALQWAGWPGFDNIRFRDGYVSSYNRQTRNPNWVCQHLCKETLTGDGRPSILDPNFDHVKPSTLQPKTSNLQPPTPNPPPKLSNLYFQTKPLKPKPSDLQP